MRKRIDAKTDFDILADLALGLTSKEVSEKYKVSISYVSKVRTGRKKIDVYIPEQTKQEQLLTYYKSDIDKLEEFFDKTLLSLSNSHTDTVDGLIIQRLNELKVLINTRKLIKENKK